MYKKSPVIRWLSRALNYMPVIQWIDVAIWCTYSKIFRFSPWCIGRQSYVVLSLVLRSLYSRTSQILPVTKLDFYTVQCHSIRFKSPNNPSGATVEIESCDHPGMEDSTILVTTLLMFAQLINGMSWKNHLKPIACRFTCTSMSTGWKLIFWTTQNTIVLAHVGHLVEQWLIRKAKYPFRFGSKMDKVNSRFRGESRRVLEVPKRIVCHTHSVFFASWRHAQNWKFCLLIFSLTTVFCLHFLSQFYITNRNECTQTFLVKGLQWIHMGLQNSVHFAFLLNLIISTVINFFRSFRSNSTISYLSQTILVLNETESNTDGIVSRKRTPSPQWNGTWMEPFGPDPRIRTERKSRNLRW